jgi:hypothetical protein
MSIPNAKTLHLICAWNSFAGLVAASAIGWLVALMIASQNSSPSAE